MPINRKIYKVPFLLGASKEYICPTCQHGILKGVEDSFYKKETNASLLAHEHEEWSPWWISYTYSYRYVCTNPNCEEIVLSTGIGWVDDGKIVRPGSRMEESDFFDYFKPTFFLPNLKIFKIADETPVVIKKAVNESFKLFFVSPSAAANHVRSALELLLDYLKIKKYDTRNGKRVIITLHTRIELLPQKYLSLKDLFFAIKWLGNSGSHNHETTIDDVMDAYDILESILDELFDKRSEQAKKLAIQINKKKGPKLDKIKK